MTLNLAPAGPHFTWRRQAAPVKSYHYSAWQGLITGAVKTDSQNSANDLIFLDNLDLPAADAAVRALTARHPYINGRIEERRGAPWLVPGLPQSSILETLDLRSLPQSERLSVGQARIGELVWRSFDVEAGPLSRFFLVRLDETVSAIGFVIHHFVCDGLSLAILRREFLALYYAAARGHSAPALPDGVCYGDYLSEIDGWTAGPDGQRARKAALARVSSLPVFDFPRVQNVEPERMILSTPWSTVLQVASRHRTTPFTVLLAAHGLCLLGYARASRVATRIVTSGRDTASLLHTVGNLADRLYVIMDFGAALTFADALAITKAALVEAQAHAFVRDEFVQHDLWAAKLPRDVPALNFLGQGTATHGALRPPSPPASVTRPRDCYYMVLRVEDDQILSYVRYGAGRIPTLCERFGRAVWACCQTPEATMEALRTTIEEGDAPALELSAFPPRQTALDP